MSYSRLRRTHFFSFRLDFDVEGSESNSVLEVDVSPVSGDSENPEGEWFVMHERELSSEVQARRTLNVERSRTWKVVNAAQRNEYGYSPGYVLVPKENATPLSSPQALSRRKGGFTEHHLWVTAYERDEMYAAGKYQNLGMLDRGLPAWTRRDRPLARRDVVLWYTLGVTHIPRPEDWPIMPVHRSGFRLIPDGFFPKNPMF